VHELVGAVLEALRLTRADVYLTGSRAHGRAREASDWDLIALVPVDDGSALGLHPLGGREVEVDVIGPELQAWRERQELSIWVWELGHGQLLRESWGGGERYRAERARRFEAERDALAVLLVGALPDAAQRGPLVPAARRAARDPADRAARRARCGARGAALGRPPLPAGQVARRRDAARARRAGSRAP
jgi:hypothetical protein